MSKDLDKVRAYLEVQVRQRRDWANQTQYDSTWLDNASTMSKRMLQRYLENNTYDLVEEELDYFNMRAHAVGEFGTDIDPAAKELWGKIINDVPIPFIIVDTWNGEGYSESYAVLVFDTAENILGKCRTHARDCAFTQDVKLVYNRYEYSAGEDNGAVHFLIPPKGFIESGGGIIIKPDCNDYELFNSRYSFRKELDRIKEEDSDFSDDENVFGRCFHTDEAEIPYSVPELIKKGVEF